MKNMKITNNGYRVVVSATCKNSIFNTFEYISTNLNANNASKHLKTLISRAIENLKNSPYMYPVIKKYKGINLEYRRIVLGNFIMLYSINERNKTAYLSHFYYGKSNYLEKI